MSFYRTGITLIKVMKETIDCIMKMNRFSRNLAFMRVIVLFGTKKIIVMLLVKVREYRDVSKHQ
jgi:hypothetical protein